MKLIFKNIADECIKTISFKELMLYQNFINELSGNQNIDKAVLITKNEKINSWELAQFKITLEKKKY